MNLTVLYRGPLTSCNYACAYCPFSKRRESKTRLKQDQQALRRFVMWIARESGVRWRVLFTPWGEALVRRWYRDSIAELSLLGHVEQVAIQTNLSASVDWLDRCDAARVALWAAFHPTETSVADFVAQVDSADRRGALVAAGAVGVAANIEVINQLRMALPAHIAFWINPQQPRPRPYADEEIAFFRSIDQNFEMTLGRHRSLGRLCRAGHTSFTVDGAGDMRRCHFTDGIIGNIEAPDWKESLQLRPCPRAFCDCYLGVAQLTTTIEAADDRDTPFGRIHQTATTTSAASSATGFRCSETHRTYE